MREKSPIAETLRSSGVKREGRCSGVCKMVGEKKRKRETAMNEIMQMFVSTCTGSFPVRPQKKQLFDWQEVLRPCVFVMCSQRLEQDGMPDNPVASGHICRLEKKTFQKYRCISWMCLNLGFKIANQLTGRNLDHRKQRKTTRWW